MITSDLKRNLALISLCFSVGFCVDTLAQALPNPYRMVDNWAQLPDGREMGAVGKVTIDPDGEHIWALIRCDAGVEDFGWECLDSDLDVVLKFNPDGEVVESFGGGMFIWPHGLDVDNEGNVWVTDAVTAERTPEGTRGHQVIKFSPTGEVLMTLGTPGIPGDSEYSFNGQVMWQLQIMVIFLLQMVITQIPITGS